ncbi:hypothetical protein TeGR_g14211 [Tetraparma gracilis]|uniref:Uncharacterized protein n=1 Tax=Tetraparma gracilis TaxID=2962635 RepID=A0ABQ6ML95_9STRA|nr:hypothetical protein TeGR_g14211 [Tetraparma gracilis]
MKFSTNLISALACILPRSSLGARVLKGPSDGMGMGMGMSMGMGSDWAVSCPANIVTIPDEDYMTTDGMYFICTDTFESHDWGVTLNPQHDFNPFVIWYGAYSAPNRVQFRLGYTINLDADKRFPYLNCNMGDSSSLPNGYDAYCTGVIPSDEGNGNNMATMGLVKVDKDGSYECPCDVPDGAGIGIYGLI